MNKNCEIEFFRFIFSIVVVFYHSDNLFHNKLLYLPGGFLGVDFFFILTGFYFMKHINLKLVDKEFTVMLCFEYLISKIKRFYIPFLISSLLAVIVRTYFVVDSGGNIYKVLYFINEILLLQSIGVPVYAVTGVAWYLSAMVISMALLFPIAFQYRELFGYYGLLVFLIIMGSLTKNYGCTMIPDIFVGGVVFLGLLKGIAEISFGAYIYLIHKDIQISKRLLLLLAIIKYVCIAIVLYICSITDSNTAISFVGAVLLGIFILLCMLDCVPKLNLISENFGNYLGSISLYIYLNHFYWSVVIGKMCTQLDETTKLVIYLLCTFVTSIMVRRLCFSLDSKVYRILK